MGIFCKCGKYYVSPVPENCKHCGEIFHRENFRQENLHQENSRIPLLDGRLLKELVEGV